MSKQTEEARIRNKFFKDRPVDALVAFMYEKAQKYYKKIELYPIGSGVNGYGQLGGTSIIPSILSKLLTEVQRKGLVVGSEVIDSAKHKYILYSLSEQGRCHYKDSIEKELSIYKDQYAELTLAASLKETGISNPPASPEIEKTPEIKKLCQRILSIIEAAKNASLLRYEIKNKMASHASPEMLENALALLKHEGCVAFEGKFCRGQWQGRYTLLPEGRKHLQRLREEDLGIKRSEDCVADAGTQPRSYPSIWQDILRRAEGAFCGRDNKPERYR